MRSISACHRLMGCAHCLVLGMKYSLLSGMKLSLDQNWSVLNIIITGVACGADPGVNRTSTIELNCEINIFIKIN
jgi:hypothetical protein